MIIIVSDCDCHLFTDKDQDKVDNKVDNDLADNYEDDYGEEEYEYEDKSSLETKSKDSKLLSPIVEATTQKNEKDNKFTQITPSQSQQAVVANPLKPFSMTQKQNGRETKYTVGPVITSTTPKPTKASAIQVPAGFRGTVNVEKKLHTKALSTPKSFEDNSILPSDDEMEDVKFRKSPPPDSYVTVTKSVTGSLDTSKDPPEENKNFQSTYFTKSSTCGYFTFSCNIVYGANGRSRVCRPQNPNKGKC